MTLLNLMLKTGCKLIERELIISFPTNKVGKKSKKQEEENRVKHNVPILGPIIFFQILQDHPLMNTTFHHLNLLAASSYN